MFTDTRVKKNNGSRRSSAMNNFSKYILNLGIIDLPLLRGNFSWFRGEDSLQASRIDRFLISPEWNDTFDLMKLPKTSITFNTYAF